MTAFRFSLDAIGLGMSCSALGWAFHDDCAITSLTVDVGGAGVTCCHGLARSDVGAAFPTKPFAAQSGFVLRGLRGDGIMMLRAKLADGRHISAKLGRICDGSFQPLTRHFSGTITALTPRPGFDFSYLEAILRVCADQPRPLPALTQPPLLIVPVYGGLPYLRPFFASLLRHTTAPHRLVVVDDGNTDPAILDILAELETRPGMTILRQPGNGGFVAAITAGFAQWQGEHVVLLNTDIVLPAGWLERLVAPLDDDPTIASTTPFASAGSICGFPAMPADNPLYLGLRVDQIDSALRHLDGAALRLTLPTGVGFCMGLSHHALRRIGFVERDTFGAGYGEENDWCRKAIAAGFRHVLVANLFVHHAHGGSFPSEQKRQLMDRNSAIIHHRYPDYASEVAEWVLADPLAELRAFMAFVLAARAHPQGALLAVNCQAPASDRPSVNVELSARALSWRYIFHWPQGQLHVQGGNLAELAELARRVNVGDIRIGDLSQCWSPDAVKQALVDSPRVSGQ